MICTNSSEILNSTNGRTVLNYRPATNPVPYNLTQKNLVLAWDIIMQDYRNINMDNCEVVYEIPAGEFWEYFNKFIYTMSAGQKQQYMDS